MKKLIPLLLCMAMLITAVGCSKSDKSTTGQQQVEMETILNPNEYILLQNIYYGENASQYINVDVEKTGIFTVFYDSYDNTERYYVWGYNDNTKCCDWQWEFTPANAKDLPNPGSTVVVSGKFVESSNALDSYWIENAKVKVTREVGPRNYDVDTTTMGGTLERVQVASMQQNTEYFEGKSVAVYGRSQGADAVEHPYYDNCFSQPFESKDDPTAIGAKILVTGTYKDGVITKASVEIYNKF